GRSRNTPNAERGRVNAERGTRNAERATGRPGARPRFSVPRSDFRLPRSHGTRLSLRDDGLVTHAVTHTPHPTHPSGRITGRPPDDRLHRGHRDTVAAARARGQEADLVRRAGGPEVAPRRHAALGAHGHLVQQPAERVAEEPAAIVRARVHQKLGDRLTCHRNANRALPETLSAANWKGATTSGTSNRSVQPRSRN